MFEISITFFEKYIKIFSIPYDCYDLDIEEFFKYLTKFFNSSDYKINFINFKEND